MRSPTSRVCEACFSITELPAIRAGARQVEVTINGIGERAGNTSLAEVVMALKTRYNCLPFQTGINTGQIYATSKLVSMITGIMVQPNKAVVGANAFAHEAGIHQDGVLKNVETFEIMKPEDIGLHADNIVMGKHSGRHALRMKLKELGYDLGDNAFVLIKTSVTMFAAGWDSASSLRIRPCSTRSSSGRPRHT